MAGIKDPCAGYFRVLGRDGLPETDEEP